MNNKSAGTLQILSKNNQSEKLKFVESFLRYLRLKNVQITIPMKQGVLNI